MKGPITVAIILGIASAALSVWSLSLPDGWIGTAFLGVAALVFFSSAARFAVSARRDKDEEQWLHLKSDFGSASVPGTPRIVEPTTELFEGDPDKEAPRKRAGG